MSDAFGLNGIFSGKNGIEIGGPSEIFNSLVPVYHMASRLDGCNYSAQNTWTNQADGVYTYGEGRSGSLYVNEASELPDDMTEKYDFLLASHCLEHCANPVKTLKEWSRAVRVGGHLLIIVPDKRFTFDHRRPTTTFEHVLADYVRDLGEDDLSHIDEIVALHDLAMDPPAGTSEQFRARSMDNFANRCLHHHVFDLELMQRLYETLHIEMMLSVVAPPHHIIVLGRKTA